jgi:hypothetical protein
LRPTPQTARSKKTEANKLSNEDLEHHIARALQSGASPLRDEVLGPLVKSSPLLFGQLLFKGPSHAPFHGRILYADYAYDWEDLLLGHDRVMIMAARGAGKSQIISLISVLWYAVTHPEEQQFIFSGTDLGAQRILENIRLEVESNPNLRWLFPTAANARWAAGQLRMSNGHHIVAKGFLTATRGFHPTRIVLDDILTEADGWSATKRDRTKDYLYSTVTNMVMPPHGRIVAVGTPMHDQDALSSLQRNLSYKSGVYPALDAKGQSTWPEVYSTSFLIDLQREIGSTRFARERLCKPVSDESSLFPRSLFMQGDCMQPMAKIGAPASYWASVGVHTFYIGVDFAFSASASADFFVICVLGVDDQQNRWLIDMDRGKGVSFSEQKARIVQAGRRYPPAIMHLESNQAQRIAADELKRETDLPIRKFQTTAEKHSLTNGLPSLRILLENNKFRFPYGDKRSEEMVDLLIGEAGNFTWQNGKAMSAGGHDDTVFALFLADRAIARGGRTIVTSDAPDDDAAQQAARQLSRHGLALPPVPSMQAPESRRSIVASGDTATPRGTITYRNGVPIRT